MVRRLNGPLDNLPLWSNSSAAAAMIELMLKLIGIKKPDRQAPGTAQGSDWAGLIDQRYDWIVLRRMNGTYSENCSALAGELIAGRPVGMLLNERDAASGHPVELGWVLVRMNPIRQYIFIDAVRKHPDSGFGPGQFTERRVIRFDLIPSSEIAGLVDCEVVIPRIPHRQRGRPRKVRV